MKFQRAPRFPRVSLIAVALLAFTAGGCEYLGAVLDKFDNSKVPAEYTPTREEMLILVEDSQNPDLIATLGDRVMSNIADELTKNKVDQLVDPGKVIAFKADDHEAYQKMSVLGLAHKFKARQVLYADVISFTVTAPLGSETAKGTLTARVKIIDAQTGQTRWPQDSGAQVITVESPTLPLKSDGSLEPLNDYIVDRLSSQIAMLFYDHPKVEKGEAEQVDNF